MKINKILSCAFLFPLLLSCDGNKQKTVEDVYVSPAPAFSADSAYQYVSDQCAYGPRVMNSAAHDSCGDYIAGKFREFGAQVIDQYADLKLYDGTPVRARNIIATYNADASVRIMLCSHWDSRPWADNDPDEARHHTPIDGANDGASGVGVLLEIARQIQLKAPEVGVDLICFDAEDAGVPSWDKDGQPSESSWCLGSQHWASFRHVDGYRARYGILLDMVGGKDCYFRKEGISMRYAPSIVDKVWSAAGRIGYENYFVNEDGGFITDDHLPVNRSGIPCIDVIASDLDNGGFCSTWHTMEDNIKNIDKQTLKAVGQTMLEVIYTEK